MGFGWGGATHNALLGHRVSGWGDDSILSRGNMIALLGHRVSGWGDDSILSRCNMTALLGHRFSGWAMIAFRHAAT